MTFADLVGGAAIFLDANVLLYHFTNHPHFGAACTDLLDRIEKGEFEGYTSAPVLGEVVHRLMTTEATQLFGWPSKGIANRLRHHPAEVQLLSRYRQAIDELSAIRVWTLEATGGLVSLAADVIRQTDLLSSDALIIATMRYNHLMVLASNDADFDRVPGITRYAPA
jgi:predicted nucleic acid-binding protein